ncbi:hypothetical protein GLYMA_04G187700v4 [Glycine max]|nr:hypothetical protein GLYMA_04G187700v4 [Glycine max]KAH1112036.1 hypothetical protein GYH30_010399 [Glycine max]KAH1254989.1 hypothetical protein GmHk_04G011310 [Glycine max]
MESKPAQTIKLLCSYGGKILPRATDGELRYVGGHTRVLTVDRSISFPGSFLFPLAFVLRFFYLPLFHEFDDSLLRCAELMVKLRVFCGSSVILRCQLPKGDLETLISITNDEDLASIIEEYDRSSLKLAHPLKIKAVLSPPKSMKKASPVPSSASASSSATHSPSGSPHTSTESLPYAAFHRIGRHNRPPVVYAIGAAKACCYTQFDGSPRFLYRGPHCNYYCH